MSQTKKSKSFHGMKRTKAKGLIYLGRIPHGFYEDEMTGYFSQFGKVTSAVVQRNKKTGRSKGYGFVEFEDEEVAKIAAETMNNYLMFNRVLQCRYIPPEERKSRFSRRRLFSSKNINKLNDVKNKQKSLSKLDQSAYSKKIETKIKGLKKFFENKGIEFNIKIDSPNLSNLGGKTVTFSDKINDDFSVSDDKSESESKTDEQFGVLEIDESDESEIQFEVAPEVKKVIKKSKSCPSVSLKQSTPSSTSQEVKVTAAKKSKKSIPRSRSKSIEVLESQSKIATPVKSILKKSESNINLPSLVKNTKVKGKNKLSIKPAKKTLRRRRRN